jgi:hypothetical protein
MTKMAVTKQRRLTWIDRLPRGLLARLHAEIDCGVESLSGIYRKWNLVRFCAPRTWRLYAGSRRRRLQARDAGRCARARTSPEAAK